MDNKPKLDNDSLDDNAEPNLDTGQTYDEPGQATNSEVVADNSTTDVAPEEAESNEYESTPIKAEQAERLNVPTADEPTLINNNPIIPPTTHKHRKLFIIAGIAVAILGLIAATIIILLRPTEPAASTNTKAQTSTQVASQGAAITYTEGTVEYTKAGKWQPVANSPSLSAGDSVRTGNAARTIIALDDGSAIRLDQNSEVTLTRLTVNSVVITNKTGNVYSRVTASTSRTFDVIVNDQTYTALGTAFKTTNDSSTEGVAVYHSKVSVKGKATVEEGKSYYLKATDTTKLDKVTDIDVNALKADAFLKWNKAEDEKETAFADKLGVLKDIDKPAEAPAQTPAPAQKPATSTTPAVGISALGAKVDNGIKVSWSTTGIDTKNGFKVAYSKSNATPAYGQDSAKYVEGSANSVTLELKDGKTWHIRVCRYDGDGKCSYYSNTVSVTAPLIEAAKVTPGTVSAVLSGNTLSWSFTGSAPYGYKVVWNTSGSPTYPTSGENAGAKYMSSGNSLNVSENISNPGVYKVRVCAYANGTDSNACLYYSNEVTYVKS